MAEVIPGEAKEPRQAQLPNTDSYVPATQASLAQLAGPSGHESRAENGAFGSWAIAANRLLHQLVPATAIPGDLLLRRDVELAKTHLVNWANLWMVVPLGLSLSRLAWWYWLGGEHTTVLHVLSKAPMLSPGVLTARRAAINEVANPAFEALLDKVLSTPEGMRALARVLVPYGYKYGNTGKMYNPTGVRAGANPKVYIRPTGDSTGNAGLHVSVVEPTEVTSVSILPDFVMAAVAELKQVAQALHLR